MDKLEKVLEQCKAIDEEVYERAKLQALRLRQFLETHDECSKLVIDGDGELFELDIRHMDVLNIIFEALKELIKLGDKLN